MAFHETRILISVIVPVYNVAPYLRRCVDSLLAQTYPNFELLLIDDGSTDDSPAICDKYNNSYVRVRAIHQSNQGVSTARNRGIEEAQGDYISFVDSDDWVEPGFLQAFVDAMGDNEGKRENEKMDLVVQGYWNHSGEVKNWQQAYYREATEVCAQLYEMEKKKLIGFVWNKLFRRQIIIENALSFDPSIPVGEDFLFCMTFLSHTTSMATAPYVGYHYIFSGDKSYSFRAFNRRLDSFYHILPTLTAMPSEVADSFRFNEFIFSLYVLHVLYREDNTRDTRLAFLQEVRHRIGQNKHLSIMTLEHPYIWLALLVLYTPLAVCDFSLHKIVFRKG